MNLNERISLEGVKVSRFGWTNIISKMGDGSFKCVLVKKNLFKGYTLIIDNQKRKINDLNELRVLINYNELISSTKVGFVSQGTVESLQQFANETNFIQQQTINKLATDNNNLNQTIVRNENTYNEEMKQVKEDFNQEKNSENRTRVRFLSESFEKVIEVEFEESGTDISYEKPNQYQVAIGRTIGNIIREPYERKYTFTYDMNDYLGYLIKETENEQLKNEAQQLLNSFSKISSNISKLSNEYSMELYVKTVSLIALFISDFKKLLIDYKSFYKQGELYYYASSTINGQNDEPVTTKYRSRKLIKTGIISCEKLLEKFVSERAKEDFMKNIEEVSKVTEEVNQETQEPVVEDTPKTM